MTRYVRVKLSEESEDWLDKEKFLPYLCVDSGTSEFTGVLDAEGNPIIRLPNPIGFGRDSEW